MEVLCFESMTLSPICTSVSVEQDTFLGTNVSDLPHSQIFRRSCFHTVSVESRVYLWFRALREGFPGLGQLQCRGFGVLDEVANQLQHYRRYLEK